MKPMNIAILVFTMIATIAGGTLKAEYHFAKEAQRSVDKKEVLDRIAQVENKWEKRDMERDLNAASDRLFDTKQKLKREPASVELLKDKEDLEERKEKLKLQLKQFDIKSVQ